MAFTVTFPHEKAKEFAGRNDSYSIDSSGVLHLMYTETTGGQAGQAVSRALSPQAWLDVTETSPLSPLSPIAGTNRDPGRPF